MLQNGDIVWITILLCCSFAVSSALAKPQETADEEDFIKLPRFFNPRVQLGEYHYFIGINQRVNWYKAAEMCAFQGMTLASIKSATEHDLLRRYLIENDIVDGRYWLGATNLSESADFIWLTDGSRMTFKYWANNVNPAAVVDGCVHTLPRAVNFGIANCKERNHFICQAPVKPFCNTRGECVQRDNIFY